MTKWSDLFTDRQLVALTTLSDLVQETRELVRRDALTSLPNDADPLDAGGRGSTAYSEAVSVYVCVISRPTSGTAQWAGITRQCPRHSFGRQPS